jgi:predicted RNase H-like nuclease (RuvC/YqgF family)
MTAVTERLGTLSNIDRMKRACESVDADVRDLLERTLSDAVSKSKAAEDERNRLSAQINDLRRDISTLESEKAELRTRRGAFIADGDGKGISEADSRLKKIGVELERAADHVGALTERHERSTKEWLLAGCGKSWH